MAGNAGASGSAGVAGTSGNAGTAGTDAGGCDRSKSPAEEACLISDRYGVFVSAQSGDDTSGDGTRGKPYKTIGKGITAAKPDHKLVFACADGGAYAETITIDASFDGSGLYGGFKCADWTYSTDLKAKITSPTATAVKIENLTTGLVVENFEIVAADARIPGESSFAMIANLAQQLILRRVKLVAGNGAAGAPGADGTRGADAADPTAAQLGKPATCTAPPDSQAGGKWEMASACGSLGGQGGVAAKDGGGGPGNSGAPLSANNGGAAQSTPRANGIGGTAGSNGMPGTIPPRAAVIGAFNASGYAPADGKGGPDGHVGQGGGGGGASAGDSGCIGASGGAGGMGGCGGTGGKAGAGGGASIALLAWSSTVTLDACELVAASGGVGGKGGSGGLGGAGKAGAAGGPSGSTPLGKGGDGGAGGNGGPGASGSGGSGGPSYALVFHGSVPSRANAPILTPGSGGLKGAGGSISGLNPAPDGFDGASGAEYEQQ